MSKCNFNKKDGNLCKLNSVKGDKYCHIHTKECSICCDKLFNQNTEKLQCGHTFHEECVKEWFERDNRCPLCRNENIMQKFSVHISNNPLLVEMNCKFFLEQLQQLENKDTFKFSKLAIDVIDRETAGIYSFHEKELLGTFKIT